MKKFKIIAFIILLIFIVAGILFLSNKSGKKEKQEQNHTNQTNYIENEPITYNNNMYNNNGNNIVSENKTSELPQIPKAERIQGIVELNHDGRIFMFNGQHFGEFGFEMEEYTEAHIANNNQIYIDYVTHIEHNVDYIQEGDVLICSKDMLKQENQSNGDGDKFIVLKAKDYEVMKREALNNEREHIISVGEYYDNDGTLYLKYNISDGEYDFPFAIKVNLTENVKILGQLEEGITVKVQYKDINVPLDQLEVQAIEIVEY